MKLAPEENVKSDQLSDFPTLITVICHLMTLYALRSCEPLAVNINRHMQALMNSSAGDNLGDWKTTFQKLQEQWSTIAERHIILRGV